MQQFEIIFYDDADGKEPVTEFIQALDGKMRAKVVRTISMLADNGPELREPHSKSLGDGIFELRTQQSNNITRVLYFFIIGRKIVLTNGFVKKTQKTPAAEIERAKKYRTEFLNRKENQS